MSDFVDVLVDLLPEHNALKKKDNQLRKVLDKTVGSWFDDHEAQNIYDNVFLDTATGKYLDLFGKDYGVSRRLGESDEDYRLRIIQEKNDNLTPAYLQSVYGLTLYAYISGFNVKNNTLTSDNPYLSNEYMSVADDEIISILNHKFIMDMSVFWIYNGYVDYVIDNNNVNILNKNIYQKIMVNWYFSAGNVKEVSLHLFNVLYCSLMFRNCSYLKKVVLHMPNLEDFKDMFYNCTNIELIDVSIPSKLVDSFKSYVLGLHLQNLTSFIINGEEVEL